MSFTGVGGRGRGAGATYARPAGADAEPGASEGVTRP